MTILNIIFILIIFGFGIYKTIQYTICRKFSPQRLHHITKKLFKKTGVLYLPCMKIYGAYFLDKPVLFLMDTGATSNFISESFIDQIYPQYKQYIELGDDVMSINGTTTLNKLVDVPFQVQPSLKCKEHFSLLSQTDSLDYLSEECGYQVIGIVGTEFLKKYNFYLNFRQL